MTMGSGRVSGIALHLDAEGRLLETLRDDLGVTSLRPGCAFTTVVDRESAAKAALFLSEITAQGAAFRWELNLPVGDSATTLLFAGAYVQGGMLLLGANSFPEVFQFYEELISTNNEQVNLLRMAIKERSLLTPPKSSDNALLEDISRLNNELVNTQRTLSKTNAELEALSRQKSLMLGMAAHDLRNPLGMIMSYGEFLEEAGREKLDEAALTLIQDIRASSRYMLSLVEDLLDVAKVESGILELNSVPTDLAALCREALTTARALASLKHIRIDASVAVVPRTMADQGKLRQVLNNLLSNAVKYSPPGGLVTVSLASSLGGITFSVRDQGQGIASDALEGIFVPFRRGGPRTTAGEPSTGLGLAIVKRLVEGHGGTIAVESSLGDGSCFTVSLPVQPPKTGGAGASDAESGVCAQRRVLVAEDEPLNRKVMQRFLDRLGCVDVAMAEDGAKAVEIFRRESFDIVFLDLEMPCCDGFTAARAMRGIEQAESRPPARIIALTAHSGDDILCGLSAAGLDGRLLKPFDLAHLRSLLAASRD